MIGRFLVNRLMVHRLGWMVRFRLVVNRFLVNGAMVLGLGRMVSRGRRTVCVVWSWMRCIISRGWFVRRRGMIHWPGWRMVNLYSMWNGVRRRRRWRQRV
jgi:hypothetical protein